MENKQNAKPLLIAAAALGVGVAGFLAY